MKKVFTLITVLALASCGQKNDSKQADGNAKADSTKAVVAGFTAPKDWTKLDQAAYSIQYPATWTLDQSGANGVVFMCKSPAESPADNFQENVNMTTEDLTGRNIDLDGYTKASVEQVKSFFKDMKIVDSKTIKDAAGEHQQIIYTASMDTTKLQIEQCYRIINNKAYILTLTTLQSTFAKYKDLGENIMSTFVVKS